MYRETRDLQTKRLGDDEDHLGKCPFDITGTLPRVIMYALVLLYHFPSFSHVVRP